MTVQYRQIRNYMALTLYQGGETLQPWISSFYRFQLNVWSETALLQFAAMPKNYLMA